MANPPPGGHKVPEEAPSESHSPSARPDRAAGYEYAKALTGMMETGGEAAAPPRRARGSGRNNAVVVVCIVLLAGIAGWSLYGYYGPLEQPPVEVQQRAARIVLFHAVQAIEAERQAKGSLPGDLAALTLPKGDYEYLRADTGYTLYLTLPDVVLSHRSGDDVHRLLREARVP